jgi:tungstate transport system substrate-binding protein
MVMRILTPLLLATMWLSCGADDPASSRRLRLATTTSTYNSGLLDHLLPPFEAQEGIEVQVLSVGTGQALALGESGDVDVVLVHARQREDDFVARDFGVNRHDLMWNDFVILGPPEDPAGVDGEIDAADALARILAHGSAFVSRADDSGTHIRELQLWEAAGVDPHGTPGYLEAGQGMGNCLTIADEKKAYLLADRGTFLAFSEHIDLKVLVAGDPRLRNPYGIILVNPERHPHVAAGPAGRLIDYLTSAEGQQRIAAFKVNGHQLFHPFAAASALAETPAGGGF